MSNRQGNVNHTFRMAFIRRKIRTTFQSNTLKAALLAELSNGGPDLELVVKMVERVQVTRTAVVQPMQPVQATSQYVQPAPAQPAPAQPAPAVNGARDGSSEESALEILDSEDELVQEMTLSPMREQRLRRQLQIWRERLSSSSE